LVAEDKGRFSDAQESLEEGLSQFRLAGDQLGESHALLALGKLLARSGRDDEATTVRSLGGELLRSLAVEELPLQDALLRMTLSLNR
jgi:hypothetical protein